MASDAMEEPAEDAEPGKLPRDWRSTLFPWHATPDNLAFLGTVDLFRTLRSGDKHELAEELQVRVCQKGERIISKGEDVRHVFIVEEGEVFSSVDGEKHKEFERSDFFGHDAIVTGRSSVDVTANASPTRLLVLGAADGALFHRIVGPVWDAYYVSYAGQHSSTAEEVYGVGSSPLLVEGMLRDQSDTFDDEIDGELPDQACRRGARKAIHNEPCAIKADWIAPVHSKLPAQRKMILRSLLDKSLLAPLLLADNVWPVVDAFMGPRQLRRGEVLTRQGQILPCTEPAFFILVSGKLEAFQLTKDVPFPGRHVRSYDGPGQCFGELEVLHNVPRTVSVIAAVDSVVFSIERDTFNNCICLANAAMQARRENMLRSIDILECLKVDEVCRLAEVLKTRTYSKDDCILAAGQDVNEVVMVEVGSVTTMTGDKKGQSYGPGEYFGELALLRKRPSKVSRFAFETPTRIAVLEVETFARLFGTLAEVMAARRRKVRHSVNSSTQSQVSGVSDDVGSALFSLESPMSVRSPYFLVQSEGASQADINGVASQGALLGLLEGGRPGMFLAWYPQRTLDVGGVQGPYPLAPGERFSVTVRSRGTFGEIGIGLAPWRQARPPADQSGLLAITDGSPKGASMVGWAKKEVGFHGDHGHWYHAGKNQGNVSPQWAVGDVLTCGLTQQGCVYFLRSGYWIDNSGEPLYFEKCVVETEGSWSVAHAYPTITFFSGGAELVVDLSRVDAKSTHEVGARGRGGQASTESQWDLMDMFRKTTISDARRKTGPGLHFMERWLGFGVCGSCSEIESATSSTKQ